MPTTQIAPVVEELMKLLPLLFFLIVFEPDSQRFSTGSDAESPPVLRPLRISVISTENGAGQIAVPADSRFRYGRDACRLRQRLFGGTALRLA